MHPELNTGRNQVEFELPPGHTHQAVWLDPEAPATSTVMQEVVGGVASIFSSPYIHIGGDEPRGMPHHLYASYVAWVRENSAEDFLSGGSVQGRHYVIDRRLLGLAYVLAVLAVGSCDFVGQIDDELTVLLHLNRRGLALEHLHRIAQVL